MPDPGPDQISLFLVRAPLQQAAEEIARQALTVAPACPHPGAVLVSALDPHQGPWCAGPCGYGPMADLLTDPLCSLCREHFARDGVVTLDGHGLSVVTRLCPRCAYRPVLAAASAPGSSTPTPPTPHRKDTHR